jgi:hypothetical protein
MPHHVSVSTGQANREELAPESTGDSSSWEQAPASYPDYEIEVTGLKAPRQFS